MRKTFGVATMLCAALLASNASAQDSSGEAGRGSGKPNPLNNVYFGEQHLHTANSPDAFAMGTRNTPDDAYRFCKGEAIKKSTTGKMVQKKTPYDWCAVTDHAEYLGIMPLIVEKGNPSRILRSARKSSRATRRKARLPSSKSWTRSPE